MIKTTPFEMVFIIRDFMKKDLKVLKILIIIMVPLLLFYGLTRMERRGVREGMTYVELASQVPDAYFLHGAYAFYDNLFGNPVVVTLSAEDYSVTEIQVFEQWKTRNSAAAIESVEDGTTVPELVKKFGTPRANFTSGISTLCFLDNEGLPHYIYLTNEYRSFSASFSSFIQEPPVDWYPVVETSLVVIISVLVALIILRNIFRSTDKIQFSRRKPKTPDDYDTDDSFTPIF